MELSSAKTQLIEQTKHNTWTGGREGILRSSLKLGPGLTDILYLIYRGKSL